MASELAKKQSTELAVPDYIRQELGDEFDDALRENIEGESRALPQIKVLHGAELFKMPDGSKVDSFRGVVLFKHHTRAYYDKADPDKTRKPPICFSNDGRQGSLVRDEKGRYGDCKTCILSQFTKKDDGTTGGALCAEKVRHLVMVEGSAIPYVLVGSTKSLAPVRDYMVILTAKSVPYFCVITEFKLTPGRKGEQQWSELALANAGYLPQDQIKMIKEARGKVEERVRTTKISLQEVEEAHEPEAVPNNF